MALKFRRGTAAQKSGSLAFGEPYVNTTLGTLQVGLDTGDLTLTSVGPTTQFEIQSISASAFVSASSIYSTNGITGSIAATNGIVSGSSQVSYTGLNSIPSGIISSSAQIDTIFNIDGLISGSSQITYANVSSIPSGIVSGSSQVSYTGLNNIPSGIISSSAQIDTIFNIDGLVSGSAQITPLLPTGTVSGSSQITLSSTTGGGTSATPQFARLGIGKAADTLIGIDVTSAQGALQATTTGQSVTAYVLRATNALFDNSLFYGNTTRAGSSAFKLLDLRTDGGSTNEFYVDGNGAGWFASDVTASNFLGGIRATNGVVSGSSQITYASISSIPAGIVSGSSQVVGSSITTNTISLNGTSVALGGTATIPNLVSGSSQISYLSVSSIPSGIVSGSSQVTFSGIGSLPTLVSGSSQITYANVSSIPAGIVSGSSQVTLSSTTGYGSVLNQAVLTSSSPTFAGLTINGAITATGDITAYYTSDKRHKNNIQIIPNALEKITKLNGVTWEWNDDVNEVTKSTPKTGLIAQEVQEVLPEVVKTRDDGFLALDYSKMMGLMVEAIKEQQTQIHSLTLEIEKLKEPKGL